MGGRSGLISVAGDLRCANPFLCGDVRPSPAHASMPPLPVNLPTLPELQVYGTSDLVDLPTRYGDPCKTESISETWIDPVDFARYLLLTQNECEACVEYGPNDRHCVMVECQGAELFLSLEAKMAMGFQAGYQPWTVTEWEERAYNLQRHSVSVPHEYNCPSGVATGHTARHDNEESYSSSCDGPASFCH